MVYVPTAFKGEASVDNLRAYLEEELLAIARESTETVALDLRTVYVAPVRPREGMLVCADGTSWNPGAGKGIYAYLSGAWSKL